MTKKEFDEYLFAQLSTDSDLTDDEILAICCKHKEVRPITDRDWNDLNDRLGKPRGNGEALRGWTKARQLKNGELSTVANQALLEKMALHKERMQLFDERTAMRKLVRDDARKDSLEEIVKRAVEELPVQECFFPIGESVESD